MKVPNNNEEFKPLGPAKPQAPQEKEPIPNKYKEVLKKGFTRDKEGNLSYTPTKSTGKDGVDIYI